jgi:prevent-host-death family protein
MSTDLFFNEKAMSMKTISAKEAKNSFGAFLDSAQREPVIVTKRDRPVGMFFSMQDVSTLVDVENLYKEEILNGVRLGLADAEAGRVTECNEEHINNLKAKLRARLSLRNTN